jgi:hypothetical protein
MMIETPAEIIAHHASAGAVTSFCAWRKRIRKPLTETAAIRLAKTLAAINAAGGDASDALGMAEEHGWQTIKPEWYFGKRSGNQAGNLATDAASRSVTFAASFARTPSRDCF